MQPPTLVLASNNAKKIAELRQLLPGCKLHALSDVGFTETIEEPYDTFEKNAAHKAEVVYKACGLPTLSDDSGLCVNALGGAPGIFSARFAGRHGDDGANNAKLLRELEGVANREAHFVCVIALAGRETQTRTFRGQWQGRIAEHLTGEGGFGYDPLFIPEGCTRSVSALPANVKKVQSHRAKALAQLRAFLEGANP